MFTSCLRETEVVQHDKRYLCIRKKKKQTKTKNEKGAGWKNHSRKYAHLCQLLRTSSYIKVKKLKVYFEVERRDRKGHPLPSLLLHQRMKLLHPSYPKEGLVAIFED